MSTNTLGRRRVLAVLMAALICVGFTSAPTTAAASDNSLSLRPVVDTYVVSTDPQAAFGGESTLKISHGSYHALLGFDTAAVPAAGVVNSATLRLYVTHAPSSGGLQVHPAADGWSESTAWSTQPAWDSSVIATSSTPSDGGWIELPLPADALSTAGRISWGLSYSTPGVIAQVASAEDVAHAPELVLTFQSGIPAPVRQGQVTKVLTIVEENHGYDQSLSSMPYLKSLGIQYGYATNYHALTHPSLPNYLALAGGSTFGVTTNCGVTSCPQTSLSVFDQAIAAGKTGRVYAEDMHGNCQTSGSGDGDYAVRHTGWPYFTGDTSRKNCEAFDVPSGTASSGRFHDDVIAGDLPNVGWLIPNLCNDAHGCSLGHADAWLKDMLTLVFDSADWKSGQLAVVVTADEDEGREGNRVLTVVAHPGLSGKVVDTKLDHYSLTRFQEDAAGVSYLGQAAGAPDMAAAFGLTLPG